MRSEAPASLFCFVTALVKAPANRMKASLRFDKRSYEASLNSPFPTP